MIKKIKIIDIFNMISQEQEMPKKIKYRDDILKYDKDCQDYIGVKETGSGSFFNFLFVNAPTLNFINDYVEILEDNTEEIEELFGYRTGENDLYNDNFDDMYRKINELVKAIKELRKEKR